MKSLRMSALMLVLGISPLFSLCAHAQQEVDPDHFDRPAAVQMHAQKSKVCSNNKAVVTRPGLKSDIFSPPKSHQKKILAANSLAKLRLQR